MLTSEVRNLSQHSVQYEEIIDPKANLLIFPKLDFEHELKDDCELTIGDMHGNALKFIYFLVRQRVLTMSKKNYQDVIKIYKKPADTLTKKDLEHFAQILDSAKINKGAKIRLLGDELSDRGSNDYFTLKILQKITAEIPVEIIHSNHGLEFLNFYETKMKEFNFSLSERCTASLTNLGILLKKKLIEKSEIEQMITENYLPHIKILSYTLDKEKNNLTLYMHAPNGPRTIEELAKDFKVAINPKNLLQTIDEINKAFTKAAFNKKLVKTSKLKLADACGIDVTDAPLAYPFVRMIWTRGYDSKSDPLKKRYNKYNLFVVHGHDGEGKVPPKLKDRVINMDNLFGKKTGVFTGTYNVLFTQHKSTTPKESKRYYLRERPTKRQRIG